MHLDRRQFPPRPAALSPQASDWLDQLQAHSKTIQTFQANVRYERIQGLQGDKQIWKGVLLYTPGPPARFAIHFDKHLVDERLDTQNHWYVFDGAWLVEKIEGDGDKKFYKHQIVAPAPRPKGPTCWSAATGHFPCRSP